MASTQIRFEYRGGVFFANSPDEVGPIMRSVDGAYVGAAPAKESGEPRVNHNFAQIPDVDVDATQRPDVLAWTQRLLTLIVTGPNSGAGIELVMAALQAPSPKGVGGRSALVNRCLEGLGFKPKHVYSNDRTNQGRFWKAKPKIHEALRAVEQALAKVT